MTGFLTGTEGQGRQRDSKDDDGKWGRSREARMEVLH